MDLDQFHLGEKIDEDNIYKLYNVISKSNKESFTAKISKFEIHKLTCDEKNHFSQDLQIISQLNHPLFFNVIGYSSIDFNEKRRPTILFDFKSNIRLSKILNLNLKEQTILGWNDTTKLICIYGIAFEMSYLHSLNIIHRNLNSASILLDDNLFPKIYDFGLSKKIDIETCEYSKSSDVYSFSNIVYEIISNKSITKSFLNHKKFDFSIENNALSSYIKLIESCRSENPKKDQHLMKLLIK